MKLLEIYKKFLMFFSIFRQCLTRNKNDIRIIIVTREREIKEMLYILEKTREAEQLLEWINENEKVIVYKLEIFQKEIEYDFLMVEQIKRIIDNNIYWIEIPDDKIKENKKLENESSDKIKDILLKIIFTLEPENNYYFYSEFLNNKIYNKLLGFIGKSETSVDNKDYQSKLFKFLNKIDKKDLNDYFERLKFIYTPLEKIQEENILRVLKTKVDFEKIGFLYNDELMKELKENLILRSEFVKVTILEKIRKYLIENKIYEHRVKKIEEIMQGNDISNDFNLDIFSKSTKEEITTLSYLYLQALKKALNQKISIYDSSMHYFNNYKNCDSLVIFKNFFTSLKNFCYSNFFRISFYYKWYYLYQITQLSNLESYSDKIVKNDKIQKERTGEREFSEEKFYEFLKKIFSQYIKFDSKSLEKQLEKNTTSDARLKEVIDILKREELILQEKFFQDILEKNNFKEIKELNSDKKEQLIHIIYKDKLKSEKIIETIKKTDLVVGFPDKEKEKFFQEIKELVIIIENSDLLEFVVSKLKDKTYEIPYELLINKKKSDKSEDSNKSKDSDNSDLKCYSNITKEFKYMYFNFNDLINAFYTSIYYRELNEKYSYISKYLGTSLSLEIIFKKSDFILFYGSDGKLLSKDVEGYSCFEETITDLSGREEEWFIIKSKNETEKYLAKYVGRTEEKEHVFEANKSLSTASASFSYTCKVFKQEAIEKGEIEIYEIKTLSFKKKFQQTN